MKQEFLDALNGSSFQSSVSGFQETGEAGDVGTDACHPERIEAESKDLEAPSVAAASRRDSSPRGGAKDEARAVEGAGPYEGDGEARAVEGVGTCGDEVTTPPTSFCSATSPCTGEAVSAPVILSEAKDLKALSVGAADSSPIGGARNGAEIRAHWERLHAEAAEMPGFDLDAALRDPAFVRLTAPGVGVPVADAWYALHREESERQSAAENRAMLARAAAASALRPREGGGSGGAALIASDYRSLPRREQLRVKQRIFEAAARGEKVYP